MEKKEPMYFFAGIEEKTDKRVHVIGPTTSELSFTISERLDNIEDVIRDNPKSMILYGIPKNVELPAGYRYENPNKYEMNRIKEVFGEKKKIPKSR